MAEGRRWWRNGAAPAWRGTSHHGPSTTIRHASGTAAGRSWCNGSWRRLANYADRGTRSRCTMFVPSKTSTPRGGNTNPNGPRGWPPAAARPSSSAASATRTSTPDVQHADHDEHRRASCYGKRARLVRRGAVALPRVQPNRRVFGMNPRVLAFYGLFWSLGSPEPVRRLPAGVSRSWRAMAA